MLLFALAVGGGIGAAITWVGRPQLVVGAIVIAVGAIGWGFTKARNPRPQLWMPPGGGQRTLVFDVRPREDRRDLPFAIILPNPETESWWGDNERILREIGTGK